MRMKEKCALSLALISTSLCGTVEAAGALNIFRITDGYNDGPANPAGIDNYEYFGFDFHNGKMAAVWMDDSAITTPNPPGAVPNFVFGSAQVNNPWDVVVGPNVLVSGDLNHMQGEPALAIDRKNTNNMFITGPNLEHPPASRTSVGMLLATSSDAGQSWTTNHELLKNNFMPDSKIPIPLGIVNGDVQSRFDTFGNLFMSHIAAMAPTRDLANQQLRQFPYHGYLNVSCDEGKSFKTLLHIDPITLNETAAFIDFPELAVGRDQVAVAVASFNENFQGYTASLYILPVHGKGRFGDPRRIELPQGTTYGNGYGTMAFSPAGGLLMAQTDVGINGSQSCGVIFTSFLPRGANEFPSETTFQPFKNVGVGGFAQYPPQPSRPTWTHPRVDYVYNAHHYGRAYMAYIDNPFALEAGSCSFGGYFNFSTSTAVPTCNSAFPLAVDPAGCPYADTNVYVVYSDDDGKSWSTPFPIPKTNNNTRLVPKLTVDQTTGNIGVAWLDAVNDTAAEDRKVQVFATVIPFDFFD